MLRSRKQRLSSQNHVLHLNGLIWRIGTQSLGLKRRWHVLDRIPICQPELLSGEGSIGKSLLILHLLASTALGRDWLGFLPEPGPSWYLGSGSTSMCPMRT